MSTLRTATIAALILMIPYNIHFDVFISEHSPYLAGSNVQATFLGPVDVLFVLLTLLSIPLLRKRSAYASTHVGQIGVAVFIVVVAVGLVLSPSIEGTMMMLRVVGVLAVVVAVRDMSKPDLVVGVVWIFMLGASLQALIALSQTFLYDSGMIVPATTLAVGRAWTAGRGSFGGNYTLAAYLILASTIALSFGIARGPRNKAFGELTLSAPLRIAMWLTVVLSSAAIATTFGRTALLSVAVVGGTFAIAWLVRRHRILAISAAMTLVPFGVSALLLRSGWLVRASQSADLDLTTRGDLAATAITMITSNPIVGIGPVQYGPYLATMGLDPIDPHVVHNLSLLFAAEFGIAIGVAFTVWLLAMGVRAFRGSAYAVALYVALIPYFMLDNLHYVYGNGLAMFALWIAFLDYMHTSRESATDTS